MPKPTSEDLRVLRILAKEDAYELLSAPLRTPRRAVEMGWAEYGPEYPTMVGARRETGRTIRITDAGRAVLAGAPDARR